jgi:hypothetical protein
MLTVIDRQQPLFAALIAANCNINQKAEALLSTRYRRNNTCTCACDIPLSDDPCPEVVCSEQ